MEVRRLSVSALCLLLLAASGCGPKHVPVNITVLIPSQAGAPPYTKASSVLAEKGATLTFEADPGSPSDTILDVQFLEKGVPQTECVNETTTTLEGPSPLTCQLRTTGDFDIIISENSPGRRRARRPPIKAYIRPCKGCS